MAALRRADGAFLLGEMAPPTTNGGQIYFPAGAPDPSDLFDGKVDLEASACRELLEETGVRAEEAIIGATWTVVFAGSRIACIKLMTLPLTADKAKARIEVLLARGAPGAYAHAHRSPRFRHRRSAHARLRFGLSARGARRRPAPLLNALHSAPQSVVRSTLHCCRPFVVLQDWAYYRAESERKRSSVRLGVVGVEEGGRGNARPLLRHARIYRDTGPAHTSVWREHILHRGPIERGHIGHSRHGHWRRSSRA